MTAFTLGTPPLSTFDRHVNGEIQKLDDFSVKSGRSNPPFFPLPPISPGIEERTDTFEFVINDNFKNSHLQLYLHDLTGEANLRLFKDINRDGLYTANTDELLASGNQSGNNPEIISYYLPDVTDDTFTLLMAEVSSTVYPFTSPLASQDVFYSLDIVAVNTGPEQSENPIELSVGRSVSLDGAIGGIGAAFSGQAATTYMFEVAEPGTITANISTASSESPIVRIFDDTNENGIFDSDDQFFASNLQGNYFSFEAEEGLLFGQILSPSGLPTAALDFMFDVALHVGEGLDEALDFDPLQYLASHDDLISRFGANIDIATEHYFNSGLKEGRVADQFDEVRYVASNSDLIAAFGTNFDAAVEHYVNFGSAEGRPTELFDPVSYLASNADLQAAFGNNLYEATRHYIQFGAAEGRSTGESSGYEGRLDEVIGFDPLQYLASHDDLTAAFGLNLEAAANHYLNFGLAEERAADLFDEVLYVASNGDLINAFGTDYVAATEHYVSFGMSEGRSTDSFDPASYLDSNADLRAAFGDDLLAAAEHYIQYGAAEGRPV
jgi:hypothetical protein